MKASSFPNISSLNLGVNHGLSFFLFVTYLVGTCKANFANSKYLLFKISQTKSMFSHEFNQLSQLHDSINALNYS